MVNRGQIAIHDNPVFHRAILDAKPAGNTADATGFFDCRSLILGFAKHEHGMTDRMQFDQVMRTGFDALSTGRAFFRVNDRQKIIIHVNGIEWTGSHTIAIPHTTIETKFSASGN